MRICNVDGCGVKHLALGYCKKHYQRFKNSGDPLKARKNTKGMPLKDRFLSFVEKGDDCWLWVGSKKKGGYGSMRVEGVKTAAHRVSYTIYNGVIPVGLSVLHKCDNPKCVNPDHLFLGTQKDNMHDMVKKGRHRHQAVKESK